MISNSEYKAQSTIGGWAVILVSHFRNRGGDKDVAEYFTDSPIYATETEAILAADLMNLTDAIAPFASFAAALQTRPITRFENSLVAIGGDGTEAAITRKDAKQLVDCIARLSGAGKIQKRNAI